MSKRGLFALAFVQAVLWAGAMRIFTDSVPAMVFVAVASLGSWMNGWVDAKNEKGQPVSEPPPK